MGLNEVKVGYCIFNFVAIAASGVLISSMSFLREVLQAGVHAFLCMQEAQVGSPALHPLTRSDP